MAEGAAHGSREEFKSLVEELEDIELRRTGTGGFASVDDGSRRQHIERRLIELLTTELERDERRRFARVPCELWVKVRTGAEEKPGLIVDLGAGGLFVETALRAGSADAVEVEVDRRSGEQPLRLRGKVAWSAETRKTGRAGLGIVFSASDEGTERRLRRLILELLRKRLPE